MNLNVMSDTEAQLLDNASPANQARLLGSRVKYLLDTVMAGMGNTFYLDPANGSDGNDGKSVATAVKTLTTGYGLLRDGYNDTLVYIAGTGSINLSATLTWDKSYAHLIGLCSPVGIGNRARIFQAAATGISPLIDITGSGCVFKNIYVNQGVADATSKICVRVTGQRNYFENCHFTGINNATQDVAGASSLNLSGAQENLFMNCFIGSDTQITRGANSTELAIDTAATRNRFKECTIYAYISHASHALVTVAALGIDRFMIFEKCLFMTDSVNQGVSLTQAFSLPAMTQGKIILKDSSLVTDGASGTGAWDATGRGLIWNNVSAPAAVAGGGFSTKR